MECFKRHIEPKKALDIGVNSTAMEEKRLEEYKKALNIVIKEIQNDPDLFYSYQSNIAMSFIDSEHNYRKNINKKYLNRTDKHLIANEAARNFLEIWSR